MNQIPNFLPEYDKKLFDKIRQYFEKMLPLEHQHNQVSIEALDVFWSEHDPLEPDQSFDDISEEEYLNCLDQYLFSEAVQTFDPKFIGHMTSALPKFHGRLGQKILQWNQNQVKIETSRILTVVERSLIAQMHRLFYQKPVEFYDQNQQNAQTCLGVFCSGGTLANLMALWVARNQWQAKNPNIPLSQVVIIASELAHYSIQKALNVLGFNPSQLRRLAISDQGVTCSSQLEQEISTCQQQGLHIMALIGIAGSTETGSLDDLTFFSKIAKQHNIYFHVDAAWGGAFMLSSFRQKLAGIEQADSITVDPHKQFFCPMGLGLILFKNENNAKYIEHHANYIIRKGSIDLGQYALEGSRPANMLYLHANFSLFGLDGYQALLDRNLFLAQQAAEIIHKSDGFEVISWPVLNILTYRFNPWKNQKNAALDSNQINTLLDEICIWLQKKQRSDGQYFVSRTKVLHKSEKVWVFRMVLANPLTNLDHIKSNLAEQLELLKNSPFKNNYIF